MTHEPHGDLKMADRDPALLPAPRLEFNPLVEDLLDDFEPFVDPNRPDWRGLLGERLTRRLPPPLLNEDATYTQAYCHSVEARLAKLWEMVTQLYKLVWTGQVNEPGGSKDQPDAQTKLRELGRGANGAPRPPR
jgi:hypothetical protein